MNRDQFSKVGNALVPEPPLALWAKVSLLWAVLPTIWRSGGLWIGGTLKMADGWLRFDPNALNRVFLAGDVAFAIDLADLQSVRVEKAMATNIIVLSTVNGEKRFRCTGAKELADEIDAMRGGAEKRANISSV